MSNSSQPHGLQPTRLLHPWDFPGKSTRVGCHYLLRIFRTDLLQDGLVGSPCYPRDSQECSPTPQFKSINSLALSFLYSPSLTSIHDYWKKCNCVGGLKTKQTKKKTVNFTLPLWSLHSLCEDTLNEQCWIEDDGLCGTDGKGS